MTPTTAAPPGPAAAPSDPAHAGPVSAAAINTFAFGRTNITLITGSHEEQPS
ncbi:hypothetical protein ACFWY6_24330 [Streptomyces sp. NPDC059037]|uniref:hypothetical protein n=1 Tax=Streptomyces sp. NPDC059037 TaxID=3346710 RepID=UPI00369D0E24